MTRLEMRKRRELAVRRVLRERLEPEEVARVLGVSLRAVQLWVRAFRDDGRRGLLGKPHPGRHSRLTPQQVEKVRGWVTRPATEFGFATELWTGARVADIIFREFKVRYSATCVCQWLVDHGMSSQKPERVPRERDEERNRRWVREDWSRIKKRGSMKTPRYA